MVYQTPDMVMWQLISWPTFGWSVQCRRRAEERLVRMWPVDSERENEIIIVVGLSIMRKCAKKQSHKLYTEWFPEHEYHHILLKCGIYKFDDLFEFRFRCIYIFKKQRAYNYTK